MYGIESLSQLNRPNLAYVEGITDTLRVAPAIARTLQLREGQILNATIESRPEGHLLLLNSRKLEMPNRNWPVGREIKLKVLNLAGNFYLRIFSNEGNQAVKRGPVVSSGPELSRFQRLLNTDTFFHLSRFFDSMIAKRGATDLASPLAKNLIGAIPSAANLSSEIVKQNLVATGLFLESDVLKKPAYADRLSYKSQLILLLNKIAALGGDTALLSGAIDEIESFQLNVLASNKFEPIVLNWFIPLADLSPVHVKVYKRDSSPDSAVEAKQEGLAWEIEMDLTYDSRRFSLEVTLINGSVSVRAWVPDTTICSILKEGESQLDIMLRNSGLKLESLKTYPTEKKGENEKSVVGGLFEANV